MTENPPQNETIFIHVTQRDLPFVSENYLLCCHCGMIAGEMRFHVSAPRAGRDETTAGILAAFRRQIQSVPAYLVPSDKMNQQKDPKQHLQPIPTRMAGCRVPIFSVMKSTSAQKMG